jgi:uncharacterized protein (DUF2249 family)
MKITKDTLIKKIINKETIDKIRAINEHFNKIEPWKYEKYADSKFYVKDLVKIGEIHINVLLKHIETFGFEVEYTMEEVPKFQDENKVLNIDATKIVKLDVRPTIAAGADPFDEIMAAVKVLKDDETLQIINVFVPIPLVNVMKGKGYKSWTNTISDNEFHTFFTKSETTTKEIVTDKAPKSKMSFDDTLASYGDNVKEIDVRHLEMPEPMITILKEMETLPKTHVLLVNHKKIPQFLLPELESRGYKWLSKKVDDDYILFIVFK